MSSEKKTQKNEILSWVWPIVIAIVIAFVCRQYVIAPVTVRGESMESTYHDADRVMIKKFGGIERFDIIVFQSPVEDDHYIKRVIGLPGDTVKVENDKLYVNGKEYDESYEKAAIADAKSYGENFTEDFTMEEVTGETKVPEGEYFVLGDNRQNSSDSRDYGFIAEDAVDGVVAFKFWPWK